MSKVSAKHLFAFFVAILLHGWVALLFLFSFDLKVSPSSGNIKVPINLVMSQQAFVATKEKPIEKAVTNTQLNQDNAIDENAAQVKVEADRVAKEVEQEKQAVDAAEAAKELEKQAELKLQAESEEKRQTEAKVKAAQEAEEELRLAAELARIAKEKVADACIVTSHYPRMHGSPIQVGYPNMIGINDLSKPVTYCCMRVKVSRFGSTDTISICGNGVTLSLCKSL